MIVEITLAADILRTSQLAAPGVQLRLEQLYTVPEEPLRNVFWVTGDDIDTFEAALSTDPSISDWSLLETTTIGRLYRVSYAPDLVDVEMYQAACKYDGHVLDATAQAGKFSLRMRFPNRVAFEGFRHRLDDLGVEHGLLAIYTTPGTEGDDAVLTDTQRETLVAAFEGGYFDIPRRMSLAELGTQFGVSDQAVSERLRRATRALIEETLGGAGLETTSPVRSRRRDSAPAE